MRRFECGDGVSDKFWEVEQDGSDVHVRHGKVGTVGQTHTISHADDAKAAAAIDRLRRKRSSMGYVEIAAGMPTPAPVPIAAPPVEPGADADLPETLIRPRWAGATCKALPALALDPLALAPVVHWSELQRKNVSQRQHVSNIIPGRQGKGEALSSLRSAMKTHAADAMLAAWRACINAGAHAGDATRLIADLPVPLNAHVWNAVAHMEVNHPGYAIARLGLDGLPGLIAMVTRHLAQNLSYAQYFGATELAPPVARAYATLKGKALQASARNWLLAFPEHAVCGLAAAALGIGGDARNHARQALRMLAAAGHADMLMKVALRYDRPAVTRAMRALIDEEPLDLYPADIGTLPAFWTPRSWRRPLLSANGKALPDGALDTLGTMLSFPCGEGEYAGLAQVRAACTPDSLADFAWDLFRAWFDHGAPASDNWAYLALGLLGNDDCARRLAPLLTAWPGKNPCACAASGLDILAMIGSEVALMLLNGIAMERKFKDVQNRARDKIAAIADERGLIPVELHDYMAPRLDLDAQGEMLLDFGPRQFRVGFDARCKPYVRNHAGVRLFRLPKPKSTDDAELARAAVMRFKLLKKDVRNLAAQQVQRLEMAMCTSYRWNPAVFRTALVGHPLLRYLVPRLVWGVYLLRCGGNYRGALTACFRVAPDGTFIDTRNEPFELPQGELFRIGIVHEMELEANDGAGLGQLFPDHELPQPFIQIGRETQGTDYAFANECLLPGRETPIAASRLVALFNRGWLQAGAGDGGLVREFTKRIDVKHLAIMHISPGLSPGNIRNCPPQKPDIVEVARADAWGGVGESVMFPQLAPVVFSELHWDVEQLRV
ncbi:DUF4132 domain-containing protein [Massilia sp. CCM 8733]|uniref:DUF4132 domain-containing protein n=1 Tax=Massilia mucilaginosa TaxID=2609282 RepID=A0ABX0NP90_9BURK|nr:DUF4132 domain-containing protein [Massilia mucilaginosa]NHZ88573.1 DUF4132 domain-containing protein [Massilia mucilaginosa]